MFGSPAGIVFAAAYELLFLLCGCLLIRRLLHRESFPVQLTIGISLGLLLMMWLPALCAFLLGFTLAAQLTALAVLLAGIAASFLFSRKLPARNPSDEPAISFRWAPYMLCVGVATILSLYLLHTHIILPNNAGALTTGQSCYGDMCMHLGFISSLTEQQVFPPQYSIQPGTAIGYPFLCDSVSATLYTLGASLRFSYIFPMIPALFVVFSGFYLLAFRYLKRNDASVIAFLLFFVGGGLGLGYFLDNAKVNPYNFERIFSAYYETPMNNANNNVLWVNVICDMLIPQRSTLFGWALLIPSLYMLYAAFEENQSSYFPLLGIWAGSMPLVHTHSFLALFMISLPLFAFYLIRNRKQFLRALSKVLPYLLIAALLAIPQIFLFTLRQTAGTEHFIQRHFNWVNDKDPYLWFYIKNLGLPLFFLIPGLFLLPRERKFAFCAVPLWLLAELVVFQPNYYDNNKLLLVSWMPFTMLASQCMCILFERFREEKARWAFAVPILFFCLFGGILTIGREIVSEFEVFSADETEAASFIMENTPADAVFLTADNHNNAVSSLAGRNIVEGSAAYLFFHGVYEEERYYDECDMLTRYGAVEEYKEKYGITYIFLGNSERYAGADEYLFEEYEVIFMNDSVTIYKVS